MHLSDRAIVAAQPPLIEPLIAANVQPASVDLTLGGSLLIPRKLAYGATIDLRSSRPADYFERAPMRGGQYTLRPGAQALATTAERVAIPADVVARIEGKSSYARLFLGVHTAGFIDPGFVGQITIEFVNHGPFAIVLHEGMAIVQIAFSRLDAAVSRPYGSPDLDSHYQRQCGPTASAGERRKEIRR